MTDLVIIIPTRERPHQLEPVLSAFAGTCAARTRIVFAIDGEDDTGLMAYEKEFTRLIHFGANIGAVLLPGPRLRMIGTLNRVAAKVIEAWQPFAVGYMGDDHRPRTLGWDTAYIRALRELRTGFVYGDDGHQGSALPTQVAMTADIPAALGYVVPSVLNHMYCDNYWLDVGTRAECITYLPDVKVIHEHPAVHSAGAWDASYRQSNSTDSYVRDKAAYEQFVSSGALDTDARKIMGLRSTPYADRIAEEDQ